MKRYLIRRLIRAVPLVFVVIVVNFAIIHLAPGDPVAFLVSGMEYASAEFIAIKRAEVGLDKPLYQQFIIYLWGILRGDFGYSFIYAQPVLGVITSRLGSSLLLTASALIIEVVGGILLGILASKRPYSKLDNFVSVFSLVVYSMPFFWVGMLAILTLGLYLRLFPIQGMVTPGLSGMRAYADVMWHLFLPATCLGLGRLGLYSRMTRASMLEVMRQDYILTAWAKGCDENAVFYRHAFRNAVLPIATLVAMRIGLLFTGAVLIESVFSWPGIGRLLYDSITARDYTMVQAIFIIFSLLTIFGNLVADILYAALDPRIRYR
jgi:peptide/nickel transport system permease protein